MSIDLKYAFGLPPKQAIAYLKSKGMKLSGDWHEIFQEAHAKVFTVAHVARMDVLQEIRAAVQDALDHGTSMETFRKNLTPLLKTMGWWGKQIIVDKKGNAQEVQLGNPYRLKNIYNTNLQTAYMAGRYKTQIETVETLPYWQYVAVMDGKTRPAHAALNGKVFRADDPFWDTHYPPIDWGCRCSVIALTQRAFDKLGIELSSSAGNMETKEVSIGDYTQAGHELVDVSGFKTTDREGKPVTVWTGPGWNYNPGKAAYVPDLKKYDPDIVAQYKKATE
jgi:SPP1 gp7 family putative phage head morphogenesis protein